MSDQDDLIKKFAEGNTKAFTTVYEEQYGSIFYLAKSLLRDTDAATDIASDSFFKLWRIHQNFDSLSAIKAFLQVTTRNACFSHLRDSKVRDMYKQNLLYLLSQADSDDIGDFSKHERMGVFMKHVYEAIKTLPPKAGKIFELAYLDGLKNREIARKLNLKEQTVKNQKNRALELLRGVINKDILPIIPIYLSLHLSELAYQAASLSHLY